MAEARSIAALGDEFTAGTRVLLSVDDEGLHFRTDVTIPPPRALARRIVGWCHQVYRGVSYSFFPFGPAVILVRTCSVLMLCATAFQNSPLHSTAL